MEKYYVGYTNDLNKRLAQHNAGGEKFTTSFRPWRVVHQELYPDKKSAWLRERQIKRYKGGVAFKKLVTGGVA